MGKRFRWIDCLKGLAIFLVILGHSIERYQNAVGENIILGQIDNFIYGFHMMLFFMISGYIYGMKEEKLKENGQSEGFWKFTKNKLIDLGIPYIIFALLVWLGKFIFADFVKYQVSLSDLFTILINPVAFTWFIYILLWVSVIIKGLDLIIKNKVIVWGLTLLLALISCVFETNIKLIDRVNFYAIGYYTGAVIYKNFSEKICRNKPFILAIMIIFIVFSCLRGIYGELLCLKAITGISGSVLIMIIMYLIGERKNIIYNFMVFCGEITIFLYILHPIVLSSIKVIFVKLGITNCVIWLTTLIVLGFIIPIGYYFIAKRIWVLDAIFRPRKYLKK